MHSDPTWNCRVCGFHQMEPQYGDDGKSPTFNICTCCGVEFGYQDTTVNSAKSFRKKWIEDGCAWSEPDRRPEKWDLDAQLSHIPTPFQ
jgi:hypothetical protein